MSAIGRFLGRLITTGFGYVVACVAAGMAISLGIVLQAFIEGTIGISMRRLAAETLFAGGIIASFAVVYAFAPAVVGIVVAEVFRVRRMVYYVAAGGVAGALAYVSPVGSDMSRGPELAGHAVEIGPQFALYVAAGIIGGIVYWGFSGRSAGVLAKSP
ncbi:hypothetical protein [Microbaculum marinum]|uniref:Major facilitator superfamily (MFS) profile domain-containing protein n=1 Tax=Microbaculum marinum TaxID=1764581 RepID=A0AAW9RR38_9HYPH